MKKLIIVFTLFCTPKIAAADFNSKYGEAMAKAKDAAMIQSGVQAKIDGTRQALEQYGMREADRLGVAKPLGIVLFCTKVYREKALTIPLAADKKLQLKTDQAAFTFSF